MDRFHFFGPSSSTFATTYRCYPSSFFPGNSRENIEHGGKILMPPAALQILTHLNIQYPMLFKLTNQQANCSTHCGVLEFIADENTIYIPYWMFRNLKLTEGDYVAVDSVALKVASFAKFQPQSTDFLDISNPKAVLENALRDFACLTVNDVIAINYNSHVYELKVLETQPAAAVTIIECDMRVDFAPPLGYVDPSSSLQKPSNLDASKDEEPFVPENLQGFQVFSGSGTRLDGKASSSMSTRNSKTPADPSTRQRGVPNYAYEPGTLTFFRTSSKANAEEQDDSFKPFEGEGFKLRSNNKTAV